MFELLSSIPAIVFVLTALGVILGQALLTLFLLYSLRESNRERAAVHRELFGLFKKIEGLTSTKRESMLRQFDKILDNLSKRLPPTIAAEAGQRIFETESKILNRLAELEPQSKQGPDTRKKVDELIKSMESLEHTIVNLTADTVHKVMVDARRSLFEEQDSDEITLAA